MSFVADSEMKEEFELAISAIVLKITAVDCALQKRDFRAAMAELR
jgi:hypothetical protein